MTVNLIRLECQSTAADTADSTALQSEYRCARCNANCLTKSHLIRHIGVIHNSYQPVGNCHLATKEKRKYDCAQCPQSCKTNFDLTNHMRQIHGINGPRRYKCEDCDRIFNNIGRLSFHSIIHRPPQFSCNMCGQKFFRRSGMLAHSKMVHYGKKIQKYLRICEVSCQQCPAKFSTTDHLKLHLMNIHQPKEQKCPHCYMQFSVVTQLNAHLLKAHLVHIDAQSDFECKICQKKFKDKAGLIMHSRFHGNPTYSCGQCPLKFYSPGLLGSHTTRVHVRFSMPVKPNSKEVSYTCAVCCRQFGSNKKCLQQHLPIHYPKSQVCTVCQKLFHSQKLFDKHICQRQLSFRNSIPCSFCTKSFLTLDGYFKHRKYHEKPTLTCPDCPLLFYSKMSVQSHSRSHNRKAKSQDAKYLSRCDTFGCAICSRVFPIRSRLYLHINTHNPLTFSCAKCHFQCHDKNILSRHLQHFHEAD